MEKWADGVICSDLAEAENQIAIFFFLSWIPGQYISGLNLTIPSFTDSISQSFCIAQYIDLPFPNQPESDFLIPFHVKFLQCLICPAYIHYFIKRKSGGEKWNPLKMARMCLEIHLQWNIIAANPCRNTRWSTIICTSVKTLQALKNFYTSCCISRDFVLWGIYLKI